MYPAIVYKLYKRRRVVVPQPVLNQRKPRRLSIPEQSIYVSYISESKIGMHNDARRISKFVNTKTGKYPFYITNINTVN